MASHKGKSLNLDGLATISDTVAEALATYQKNLSLDGLKTISNKTADALESFEGKSLSLDGLCLEARGLMAAAKNKCQ